MESLHFLMIGMILLVDIIMSKKIIVDDEKNMSDTAVYKWYIVVSIVIAIPFFVAVWILDLAEPQPLLPFFMTLFFLFSSLYGIQIHQGNTAAFSFKCHGCDSIIIYCSFTVTPPFVDLSNKR